MCLETSYMFQIRQNSFFFFLFGGGGGGGGERGEGDWGRAEREREKRLAWSTSFFKYMKRKFSNDPKYWNITI